MPSQLDVLISVEERHAVNMLNGVKSVELRRRPIRLPKGSRVWIYSKLPRGHVDVLAIVAEVHEGTLAHIWKNFGERCCIEKHEFDSYFNNSDRAFAIEFSRIEKLKTSIALYELKKRSSRFHPPQFFMRLDPTRPELPLLQASFAPNC